VVVAKDTPGFIANRLGIYGLMQVFKAMEAAGLTVAEVDAITGPAIGRPKSATFRTMDLAGIDILAAVARDLATRLTAAEQPAFALPPVVEQLVARGWYGSKSGRGFYQKTDAGEIQALDFPLMEYRPSERPRFPSIDAARSIDDHGQRIRALFGGKDKVGEFLRATLAPTLLYAARIAGEVAGSRDDVDRAMRWGFGWELGPFETLRAIGVDAVVSALGDDATAESRDLLSDAAAASGDARSTLLKSARAGKSVVKKNAGASLVDLGDGVLCVEFHSKMNAIGGDTIDMLRRAVVEAADNFAALVVGNDGLHFSAGANLMLLLLEAQEGNWDEVDLMIRAFQGATMGLRNAAVPVVVAPAGLTLGGGCEIVLHADRVQAAAESYIGLVEAGVGLIPAGGGTKEMLARSMDELPPGAEVLPFVQRVFETIGFATVSTSGPDARRLGYLRAGDAITMNRERLVADAKALALSLVGGYVPPQPRSIPVGGPSVLAALKLGVHLAWRAGRISDHDALIGRKLAWILAGGDIPAPATVSEQQLLDLEREAFLSLCGERKTQERIAHTLKTGKPLRN
jgi:3-hydroxyacyl-CoA dehydrogenase